MSSPEPKNVVERPELWSKMIVVLVSKKSSRNSIVKEGFD